MTEQRTCVACRKIGNKKEMLRVSKSSDGYTVGLKHADGRGAYVCDCPECLSEAIKKHALNRAFKTQVPQEVYQQLKERAEDGKR